MREVTVMLDINPVSVKVRVPENCTDKEIVLKAKEQCIKDLSKGFPKVTYSISEGDRVSFNDVYVGQMVTFEQENGVVIKVNKKSINVATKNGVIQGPPTSFAPVDSNVDIEEFLWDREEHYKKAGLWAEGQTGYLVARDGDHVGVIPVVVSNITTGGYHHLYEVGKKRKTWFRLKELQVKQLLFDTKEEAIAQKKQLFN